MDTKSDASPCRNICQLDPTAAFCIGCGRTRADIAQWMQLGRADKLEVKRQAAQRLATYLKQTLKS